jgi:hypothetical protein
MVSDILPARALKEREHRIAAEMRLFFMFQVLDLNNDADIIDGDEFLVRSILQAKIGSHVNEFKGDSSLG